MTSKTNDEKNNFSISIVIPTKDRPEDLKRCLNSVILQLNRDDEIILVNGGKQEVVEKVVKDLEGLYGTIRILHDGTPNFTYALNLGCRLAKNRIIGIVNDDIVFGDYWVKSVKHWYHLLPNASSIGGVAKDMNPRKIEKVLESHRWLSNLYDKIVMGGHLRDTGIITPSGSFSIGCDIPNAPTRVSGFSGANMIVLKQVLEEFGYFNTIFKYAGAEGYFYLNLLDKRKEVFLVPGCEVKHYPNSEGGTRNPFFLAQDYAIYFKMIKTESALDWIRKNLNVASFFLLWILTYKLDFKKYSKLLSGFVSGLRIYKKHGNDDIIT